MSEQAASKEARNALSDAFFARSQSTSRRPHAERPSIRVDRLIDQRFLKTIRGYQRVRPDLILHRTNTDFNFLAIEMKKGSSPEVDEQDGCNLQVYRWPIERGGLAYRHALFLRFGVEQDAGRVTSVMWF